MDEMLPQHFASIEQLWFLVISIIAFVLYEVLP